MKKLMIVSLLLASPISNAASFNCQQASTSVEHMICDTPRLSSLDETMSETYSKAISSNVEDASELKVVQRQWVSMRNKLSTVKQLELAYGIQISGLKSISSAATGVPSNTIDTPAPSVDKMPPPKNSQPKKPPATQQAHHQGSNITLASFKNAYIQANDGEYYSTESMPNGSSYLVSCASTMANDVVAKFKKEAEKTNQIDLFFEVQNRIHTATTNNLYENFKKDPNNTGFCALINAMP